MKQLKHRRGSFGIREGVAVLVVAVSAVYAGSAFGQQSGEAASTAGITLPQGYREWALISIARVGGPVNDMRAKLGNEVAIRAFRDGQLPFPDGAIIARLAWNAVTSEENNNALRPLLERAVGPDVTQKTLSESVVAGTPTNVQFMVKDSKKFASTGGWGFAQFTNGKADGGPALQACFGCHAPAKDRDLVFTRYAR